MDIFEAIRSDHDHLRDLLDKLLRQQSVKGRGKAFALVTEEMTLHQDAEERVFYPLLLDDKDARDEALEAIEEHNLITHLLGDLEDTPKDNERWGAKQVVLCELFEHHVDEEEEEVLDTAAELLTEEEALRMGREFQADKDQARAGDAEPSPTPADEDEPVLPGNRKHRNEDLEDDPEQIDTPEEDMLEDDDLPEDDEQLPDADEDESFPEDQDEDSPGHRHPQEPPRR